MKTKWAVLWSSLLFEPFAALYPLLPVILLKGAGATGLQIVLLTMLKPVSSLFSLYWSERVSQNRQTLKGNLLGAGLLARLPFLGALFFDNVWLFVAASTLYMLFSRAGIPAWMEMLKQSLPAKERERVFSWGSAIGYAEGALIAIGLGAFLDQSVDGWKLCFAAASLLGLAGLFIQLRVPIRHVQEPPLPTNALQPWRDCYTLMKTHAPFRRFQWAFMAGGLGLMLIQPVIPVFFADTLTITYRDLMIAYSICKGLGFVTTASAWSRLMGKISIHWFTSLVLLGFSLFPLILILGTRHLLWIYIAYLLYGVAQAGSHLIWHLSGPLFAGGEKSARYSGVNIVMVGLRGLLGPPLGGLMLMVFAPTTIFFLSALCCLLGITVYARWPIERVAAAKKRLH